MLISNKLHSFRNFMLQRHTINNITIKITKPMNKKFLYVFFVLLYHCRHPILSYFVL